MAVHGPIASPPLAVPELYQFWNSHKGKMERGLECDLQTLALCARKFIHCLEIEDALFDFNH
jgi:hypothetical protein